MQDIGNSWLMTSPLTFATYVISFAQAATSLPMFMLGACWRAALLTLSTTSATSLYSSGVDVRSRLHDLQD